ncbi:hypothetical protein HYPSUDRAFT_208234 [Hypholoma sublateritium FD-334 SS-4]|uniref:Uncharacterized protein n=1 Tax=Hypholoma sublateritium (strain FD-334 SS-4) TaxID=945553 RepID=A0A0D2LVX6_HYPSF|nr:hypothetical protein HYPSUDRAFT_208234 [Hypholoma sublateritium FD-334 SS-4]
MPDTSRLRCVALFLDHLTLPQPSHEHTMNTARRYNAALTPRTCLMNVYRHLRMFEASNLIYAALCMLRVRFKALDTPRCHSLVLGANFALARWIWCRLHARRTIQSAGILYAQCSPTPEAALGVSPSTPGHAHLVETALALLDAYARTSNAGVLTLNIVASIGAEARRGAEACVIGI